MKVSLVVLTAGKLKGKAISVVRSPFVIGRDSHCHIRAASLAVSSRHCALMLRGTRVFVRDFNSTNGTRVNDEMLVGETELRDRDRLAVGPLLFSVRIERLRAGVSQPTPLPATKETMASDEEPIIVPVNGDAAEVPDGDTKLEVNLPPDSEANPGQTAGR